MTTQKLLEPKEPPTLEELRHKMFELARKTGIKPLKAGEQMFFSPKQAKDLGVEIEEGWLLKLIGAEGEAPPAISYISPEKWEVIGEDTFLSPEGEQYTRDQLTQLYEEQQAQIMAAPPEALAPEIIPPPPPAPPIELPTTIVRPEIDNALRRVYPELFEPTKTVGFTAEEVPMMVLEQIFTRAESEPETLLEEIYQKGRSPDTEALLRIFNPDMTSQEMFTFFAPPDPYAPVRSSILNIFPDGKVEDIMKWAEENPDAFFAQIRDIGINKDTVSLLETVTDMTEIDMAKFFAEPTRPMSNAFLSGVQTVFQYVDGWWKTGLMELGFKYYDLMEWASFNDDHWRSQAEVILNDAFKKHGWKAIFSSDVNEAWDVYFKERLGEGALTTAMEIIAVFTNPLYILPAGKVSMVVAKPFRGIPVLGETMQGVAKGVQLSERALAEATLLPTVGRGIKWTVGKIAPKAERYLIATLPERELLREWLFKNDYFRKVAEKIPLLGKIAPAAKVSGRLPEVLATKAEAGAAVIQETAMRNAILEVGQSTKGQALAYIRELGSTREIFGVREGLVSSRLVKPRQVEYSLALGDVLQAPERYTFAHKNGFEYAKRTQKLMQEMFELAKKEGVDIKKTALEPFEEFVHWVVTGVKNKEGVVISTRMGRGSVVGALPASMKHRRFERMLDGLNQGFIYADDVEVYVGTYTDDMFKAIADRRYGEGIKEIIGRLGKELGALPVTPKDRLWAVYPEQAKRWWLRQPTARIGEVPTVREALQDLVYSMNTVKQLARGQQIAGATLRAIENRTPAIAERIRTVSVFKGDRATKAKLEALIWKRMQAGKPIPVTLPNVRKGVAFGKDIAPTIESEIASLKRFVADRAAEGAGFEELYGIGLRIRSLQAKRGFLSVEDYVSSLGKDDVTKFYQKFTKLERADALAAELRGEFDRMLPDYLSARFEYQRAMEIVKRPLAKEGEGYIRTARGYPHPMFQNQIYPDYVADQATKLLNDEASKVLALSANISGAFRLQQAALDISAGCIQVFVGMFTHPVRWTKAQAWALAALVDPKIFDAYLVRHAKSIAERNFYLGSQRPFEYFEKMGLLQKYMGKLPFGKAILGQTYGRTESAFSMMATVYKDESWRAMSPMWIKRAQGAELARYLDRLTGMLSFRQLGMPANARAFAAGWVSFAPQYRMSVLSYFADALKGGMTGTQVRTDIARLVAAGTAMYYGFCKATGNPVYLNPYTDGKKFMSINVDGHWIGLGSAVVSLTRASVDILSSMVGMGDNEPMDFLKADKWKNPILRALIGQSAVLPQMILEIATRRDFLGYPLGNPFEDGDAWAEWGLWVGEQFTPIWLQDILYDKSGVGWSPIAALAEFIGLRTSPQTKWETLDDKLKERRAWEKVDDLTDEQRERIEVKDETVLSVLSRFQKDQMFNANQDLIEFYDDAQADALIRGSEMYQDYVRGITIAQATMTTDLNDAITFGILRDGNDTRWMRERYNDIMSAYGLTMELLRENEDLAPLFEEWDKSREKRKVDAETIDLAYWEFIENVLSPDRRLDNGDFDFEEYQEALEMWREKWGDEVYGKVLYILENAKKAIPDYPEWAIKLWQDRRQTNETGYWNLPPKPIYQMNEKDLADGFIPEKYMTLWGQYQSIKTKEERERFQEKYPDFAKDWRAELRADNPTLDATLAFWGYGGQLQSKEAYDLVSQWSKELKIPLEQIGLGMPPEHLVVTYFEHLTMVRETSGNSPEVRLFKLKRPEYLEWGVLNRGWDNLKGEIFEALEIQVDYKDKFAEYAAFGDVASENYIEDDAERKAKRERYNLLNPDFRDAVRKLAVYKTSVKDLAVIESNVDYGKLTDKFGANSAEALLFRFENNALNTWGMSRDYHGDNAWMPLELSKVPIWEINRQYRLEDEAYQAILDKYTDAIEQRKATEAYLVSQPEYARARRVREAYELGWTQESLINKFVEYSGLTEKGFWKERYLRDNRGLYQALKDADKLKVDYEFEKIPDEQYDIIYDKWADMFTAYDEVKGTAEEMAEARRRMLIAYPEFAIDRLRRIAHGRLIPNQHVEAYAEYYTLLFDGKPAFVETWYDDDWFLMEHKDFYNTMVSMELWKPKDFSKIPTREVFKLWQVYLTLPRGSPRIGYRAANKELDDWLFLTGKVSQTIPEKERQKEIGKWGVWAEKYREYLTKIEEVAVKREKQAIQETERLKKRLEELMKKKE